MGRPRRTRPRSDVQRPAIGWHRAEAAPCTSASAHPSLSAPAWLWQANDCGCCMCAPTPCMWPVCGWPACGDHDSVDVGRSVVGGCCASPPASVPSGGASLARARVFVDASSRRRRRRPATATSDSPLLPIASTFSRFARLLDFSLGALSPPRLHHHHGDASPVQVGLFPRHNLHGRAYRATDAWRSLRPFHSGGSA